MAKKRKPKATPALETALAGAAEGAGEALAGLADLFTPQTRKATRSGPYTPKRGRYKGRVFPSERQYKNKLAQEQGYKNESQLRKATPKARAQVRLAKVALDHPLTWIQTSDGVLFTRPLSTFDYDTIMRHRHAVNAYFAAKKSGNPDELRQARAALRASGGKRVRVVDTTSGDIESVELPGDPDTLDELDEDGNTLRFNERYVGGTVGSQ
jgi:hypothetical protein